MRRPLSGGEYCEICGCKLYRTVGEYALPTASGRAQATRHHYVAERFFGKSPTRNQGSRFSVFETCPWGAQGKTGLFCYECHEELLHNPVLLEEDIARLARLVARNGLDETEKPADRLKLRGRISLLHDVISAGLSAIESAQNQTKRTPD